MYFCGVIAQNPCLDGNYYEIDHVTKRSPSFDMDSTPICDRYITEGWYRAKSHVMSTSPPILGKCNTLYPVWLKGILFENFHFIDCIICAFHNIFLKSVFIIIFFYKTVFDDDISYSFCQILNEYWLSKQQLWPVNILEISYKSIWIFFCGVLIIITSLMYGHIVRILMLLSVFQKKVLLSFFFF